MSPSDVGEFLKARRARLNPSALGLPVHGRRRTVGLRRAEIAVMAGVSVDYYTRLEQGRHPSPSLTVVQHLAQALHLDHAETEHLYRLTGQSAPTPGVASDRVRRQTQLLLDALYPTPAWLLNSAMDILAWNPTMARVVVDPGAVEPERRNFALLAFSDPGLQERYVDWPGLAHEIVAALHDAMSRYVGDARLAEVVRHLIQSQPFFAQAWSRHDVATGCVGTKRLLHPDVGELILDQESLAVDHGAQRIVVYLPSDSVTGARLDRLGRRVPGATGRLRSVGQQGSRGGSVPYGRTGTDNS